MPLTTLYPTQASLQDPGRGHGINIIVVPSPTRRDETNVDLNLDSWKTSEPETRFWLVDELPNYINDLGIFLYEYNPIAVFGTDREAFSRAAYDLIKEAYDVKCTTNIRDIIFLCHSLGGLLVMQALGNMRHHFPAEGRLGGVAFLATPYYGDDWSTASLGNNAAEAATALGFQDSDPIWETIKKGDIFDYIDPMSPYSNVGYEIVYIWGDQDKVISSGASQRYLHNRRSKTIVLRNADHTGVCKFDSTQIGRDNFKLVQNWLSGVCEQTRLARFLRGDINDVQLFLDEGYDPNTKDDGNRTRLSMAVEAGDVDLARLLLKYGANPDATRPSLLEDAGFRKQFELVRLLLQHGANPNLTSESDTPMSPLVAAVRLELFDLVRLLLEYGANPEPGDWTGSTALYYAVQQKQIHVVQLLLDYLADPNGKNGNDKIPLHKAVENTDVAIVKLLIERGADPTLVDKDNNTPLQLCRQTPEYEEIKRYLLGESTETKSQSVALKPAFPIIINGSRLDDSINASDDASGTNYILIQTRTRLSPSQRQDLANINALVQTYVSENTYICRYQASSLVEIRKLDSVVYVDVYRTELKFTPSLCRLDTSVQVDVLFHDDVNINFRRDLRDRIAEKSNVAIENIEFCGHKARLSIHGLPLVQVATIDEVRYIERVGKMMLGNDKARLILGCDNNPGGSVANQSSYDGAGQVIAIADSGLDRGVIDPIHPAFANRVIHGYSLYAMNGGNWEDHNGHGTHVCGSAVGIGQLVHEEGETVLIKGTAPGANLVFQSILDPDNNSKAPTNLADLFELPYMRYGARVHSNSWGTCNDGTKPFYNDGAHMIDRFVWNHPDMVICFLAGNEANIGPRIGTGEIRCEATAKNCITVGATENERLRPSFTYGAFNIGLTPPNDIANHLIARRRNAVAAFSSRGPVGQYQPRTKPDVVAPGTAILSANSCYRAEDPFALLHNSRWCYKSGTSMATALVAGCAAVLRQVLDWQCPSAALIKALLINGANIVSPTNPDWYTPSHDSGFGRVNLANSIRVACRNQGMFNGSNQGDGFYESAVSHSKRNFSGDIKADDSKILTDLKLTMVWSDPPGELIRNNLILVVEIKDFREFRRAGGNRGNVQQIIWRGLNEYEGCSTFTVRVEIIANLEMSPQQFAIVWRFGYVGDIEEGCYGSEGMR